MQANKHECTPARKQARTPAPSTVERMHTCTQEHLSARKQKAGKQEGRLAKWKHSKKAGKQAGTPGFIVACVSAYIVVISCLRACQLLLALFCL
jgi:hypothetical protein